MRIPLPDATGELKITAVFDGGPLHRKTIAAKRRSVEPDGSDADRRAAVHELLWCNTVKQRADSMYALDGQTAVMAQTLYRGCVEGDWADTMRSIGITKREAEAVRGVAVRMHDPHVAMRVICGTPADGSLPDAERKAHEHIRALLRADRTLSATCEYLVLATPHAQRVKMGVDDAAGSRYGGCTTDDGRLNGTDRYTWASRSSHFDHAPQAPSLVEAWLVDGVSDGAKTGRKPIPRV